MSFNNASELEKLVSNCEFENHQYVKLIEYEDHLIESLQNEKDCMEEEKRRLQEALSQLDVDTKQCHKQYTINRDNVDSQKKTHQVLSEHVAAVGSKMDIMDFKLQAERQEHSQHLQRYKDIWDSYYKQYESLPFAQELKKQQMVIEDMSKKNEEEEHFITTAKQKILLQGNSEFCSMGTNGFIVTLAKMKLHTMQVLQEVEKMRIELTHLHETQQRKIELTQLQETLQRNLEETNDRNNESNLQKLKDMHLVDKESTEEKEALVEDRDQQNQSDIESPMISMLGERDDGAEAMQTDAVSPDEIKLQFVEGEVPTLPCETLAKQLTESTDRPCEQKFVARRDNDLAALTEADSSNFKSDGTNYTDDSCNSHTEVSAHGTGQTLIDGCKVQADVPTSVLSSTDMGQDIRTQEYRGITVPAAQLPFVTYKASGQESVQIHIDKPITSEQQEWKPTPPETQEHNQSQPTKQHRETNIQTQLQPTNQHRETNFHSQLQTITQHKQTNVQNQSQPMNHSQTTIQRQTSRIEYDRTNNRPQIAETKSVSPLRPSYLGNRPTVIHVAPPTLPVQFSRAISSETPGSNLRKPVLPHIAKPVQTVLSRQPGGTSRLPVLQTPRPPIVHSHQHSFVSLPNRLHGLSDGSQRSKLAATSSPLQLTTPPINCQRTQSILELPAQHHQMLHQKVKAQSYSPSHSAESLKTQFKPVQQNVLTHRHVSPPNIWQKHASPPNIGQRYAPKKSSPLAQLSHDVEKNTPTKMATVPVQQAQPDVAVPKSAVPVQDSLKVSTQITTPVVTSSPQVGMDTAQPGVHSSSQVGMDIAQSNVDSGSQVSMEFVPSDVHGSSQADIKLYQPDETDTYYMKMKVITEDSKTDQVSASPQSSQDEPVKTPEKDIVKRMSEESFSPFDSEKHRQKLADMKKSPGQPDDLYRAPVRRVFAEMEGSTGNQEPNNENMQLPLFGQADTSNTAAMPFDGSGDPTNTGHTDQTKESKSDETSSTLNREAESAFQFFDSFAKQTGDNTPERPGNIFSFGDGDLSKNEMQSSPPFSIFGSSTDDDVSSGFSFAFGNNTTKQGEQLTGTGGGSFFSMFGGSGNEDQSNSDSGFSFNFASNEAKSPSFSFF